MSAGKKLVIFFASIFCCFLMGIAIDLACGPQPDPYDYYISFFHNNLQRDSSYQRFYFNGYTFLNGDIYEAERDNKIAEGDINIKEWRTYCGGKVTYKDIAQVLYELDKKTDSLYFRNYQKGKTKMPDSLKNNSFFKYLLADEKKMAYMVLAKKSEPLVNLTYDDKWDVIKPSKERQHELALTYVAMGRGLNDAFLKLRCFCQAQRLLYYGKYLNESSDIYDKYIITTPSKSHVMGWALSLKAGVEERLGNKVLAAYLYSQLFTGYPERRVRAYYDFLTTRVPVERVIRLAKNSDEKAAIYAIKGMHNAHIGLSALEQVYKTNPRSEFVGLLLIREINKIEEGYLTAKINGGNYYEGIGYYDHTKYDSVKRSFVKYIPKLKALCNRIASERKYTEPELGSLASAYLSWIQHDSKAGFEALSAIKNKNMRGNLADEKQLIKLLLLSQSIKKLDSDTENKLLPSLTWLDKKVKREKTLRIDEAKYRGEYDLKYYSASARDFYVKVLAPVYFKQKDTVKAALCILKSEKTISTESIWEEYPHRGLGFDMPSFWQNNLRSRQLEKIVRWQQFAGKGSYLKLLMAEFEEPQIKKIMRWTKSYQVEKVGERSDQETLAATYDLLGTAYLREHKYIAAVKAFKHIDIAKLDSSTNDAYNDSLSRHYRQYADPLADKLRDYPHVYSLKKTPGYNKLDYAESMAGLEQRIKANPKNAAKSYYKMACGLYNISYYGNAWIYTAYSSASDDKYRTKGFYYDNDYLHNRTAETWFLKARSLSNDAEFKARCTFMAAKCRQTQIPVPGSWEQKLADAKYDIKFDGNDRGYSKALRNNRYFSDLKSNYSKTKFYKVAVSDCSYFRDFLAGSKP